MVKKRPSTAGKKTSEAARGAASPGGLPLVVVGASAGGIESLRRILADLPASLPGAIVIAQHLSPSRPSVLASLFRSPLTVKGAVDRAELVAGTVHVAPSDRDVLIQGGRLRVVTSAGTSRSHPSLDRLFASAAEHAGPRVLGVVLSGTGKDGAAGLQAIKAAGGTTASITLGSAQFPDMPRAAGDATALDHVVPAGQVAGLIVAFCQGRLVAAPEDVGAILQSVRRATGREFRDYKPGSIQRRLRHRMTAIGVETLPLYLERLEAEPGEAEALIKTLQIGVTRFFREPRAWASLRTALRRALARRGPGAPIRIWSCGCATGEEAYSIALLLASLGVAEDRDVKIYATDTDGAALEVARRGVYPAKALRDVPRAYRAWVERAGDDLQVSRALRRWLVFGVHDVSKDPPIARLDLLVCRNVLIYFNSALQARAFQLFRYALEPGGILFLGKSEVPADREAFGPLDARSRLYTRSAPEASAREPRPGPGGPSASRSSSAARDRGLLQEAMAPSRRGLDELGLDGELLLGSLPSAIVAVDAHYRVVLWNLAAERLFELPAREALGRDLFHHVPGLPYRELKATVDGVLQPSGQGASIPLLDYARDGRRSTTLRATISRLARGDAPPVAVLVLDDVTEIARLGEEVARASLALDAANKELQTRNELLQTTKEELETTNEELQATNQELEATNQELERRTTAQKNLGRFFEDLIETVDAGVLALGPDRRVQHANRRAVELLGSVGSGLALDDVKLGWEVEDLKGHLDRVERHEEIVRLPGVIARRRRRLDVTIAPLRDHEDAFTGFLVSLVDATGGHSATTELTRRSTEVQAWFAGLPSPVLVLGPRLEVVAVNDAARRQLGFRVEPVGLVLDDLAHGTRAVKTGFEFPSLPAVRKALARGRTFRGQVREVGPGGRVFDALFGPLRRRGGHPSGRQSLLLLLDGAGRDGPR